MVHTTVNPDIDVAENWFPVDPSQNNSEDNDYLNFVNDILVGFYKAGAYGNDWSSVSLPSTPSDGKWVERYNTDNSQFRNYVYDGTSWQISTIGDFNHIQFDLNPTVTPTEGMMWWNNIDKTINIKTDVDTTIQVGQEQVLRITNDTGVTLTNGQIVYITGANGGGRPTVSLCDATDINTSQDVIGIVTADILDTAQGFVTTFGLVRDVDTNGMVAGDELYLSETSGEYTNIKPSFPAWIVSVGHVISVGLTDGALLFRTVVRDTFHAWNGTFNENFDALVSATGGVITLSLERSGGGNLTMRFSDGFTILDTTPALTKTLTAGTDTVPQMNWAYILKSAPTVITISTSSYPSVEHIKIGTFYCFSATKTETDSGSLMNQNINNYTANVSNQRGRVELMSERIRKEGAKYEDGLDPDGVTSYFTFAAGSTLWKSTSGEVYQMHKQSVSALDLATGSHVHVVNNATIPFEELTNLFGITTLADGVTSLSNNKYFNLVFWIVANKGGQNSPLMVNLPTGEYTSSTSALRDDAKTAVYDIPREFRIDSSTAVFVVRAVFKFGATWTYVGVEDLRGRDPTISGGSSTGAVGNQVEFNDSTFRLFNNADNSKQIDFDLSGIASGNTRTWAIQDASGTVPLLESAQTFSGLNTFSSLLTASAGMAVTGALTATSYGGITEANLLDKSAVETVSGAYIFSSLLTASAGMTITGVVTGASRFSASSGDSRAKYTMWGGTVYGIGMGASYSFGGLNDYAMTFQMNNDTEDNRGWWWGHVDHTNAQGVMALTVGGHLTIARGMRIGYGETDITTPSSDGLAVSGSITLGGTVDGVDIASKNTIHDDGINYGSANGSFVPLIFMGIVSDTQVGIMRFGGQTQLLNLGTTNFSMVFALPLPTEKGALDLYVGTIHAYLHDADSNDRILSMTIQGVPTGSALNSVIATSGAYSALGRNIWGRTSASVATYTQIYVVVNVESSTSVAFELNGIQAFCYYT